MSSELQPKVTTIIVTYNGMPWIGNCLKQLSTSSYKTDVIIVDNASTDETTEFIKSNYPEYCLISQSINLGFGKANNVGIRKVLENGVDYIFLLNQDAYVQTDTIKSLVEAFESEKDWTGILSPIHKAPDGSFDFGFEDHINRYASDEAKDAIFGNKKGLYEVGFVNAACWMLSRGVIEKVGCFNPLFLHYGEDNDFINRLHYHELKLGILTKALVIHDRIQSHNRQFSNLRKRETVSFLKHFLNVNLSYTRSWIKAFDKLFRESLFYFFKLSWAKVVAIKLGFLIAVLNIGKIKRSRFQSKQRGAYL